MESSELFRMMLAGLGQCGIIVRARLRLIAAPRVVVVHGLPDRADALIWGLSELFRASSPSLRMRPS